MHEVIRVLRETAARGSLWSTRREGFARAIGVAPLAPINLINDFGFMVPASPAALICDAAVLAGGESGFNWVKLDEIGNLVTTMFWEQTGAGKLVTKVKESPLRPLAKLAGWPFYDRIAHTSGRWIIPTTWGDMRGDGATLAAAITMNACIALGKTTPLRAIGDSMSMGPCCLSMLYSGFGCRGKGSARSKWLNPLTFFRMWRIEGKTIERQLTILLSSVAHLNFGQVTPLSATKDGIHRLVSAQTGSNSRDVHERYITGRRYDLLGHARFFNERFANAHSVGTSRS